MDLTTVAADDLDYENRKRRTRLRAMDAGLVTAKMRQEGFFTEAELRTWGWHWNSGDDSWTKDSPLGTDLVPSHGERFLSPITQSPQFGSGPGRHHRSHFSDYEVAKNLIHQALGDMSNEEVWDNHVLCAVFCRPNVTPGGIYQPTKEIKEDWWQHKVVLVLKLGPNAFQGDESYEQAKWGQSPRPQPGDWLFARPEAGMQANLIGVGGTRPQGRDHRGQPMDIFEWDGWPCRIIPDDEFMGRTQLPHNIV